MKPSPSSRAAGAVSSSTRNATAHSFSTGADLWGKFSVIKASLCNWSIPLSIIAARKLHAAIWLVGPLYRVCCGIIQWPPTLPSCPPPFYLHPPSAFLFISISLMNTLQFPATRTNTVHSIVLLSFFFFFFYVCMHIQMACTLSCMCVPCLHLCLTEKAGRRECVGKLSLK